MLRVMVDRVTRHIEVFSHEALIGTASVANDAQLRLFRALVEGGTAPAPAAEMSGAIYSPVATDRAH